MKTDFTKVDQGCKYLLDFTRLTPNLPIKDTVAKTKYQNNGLLICFETVHSGIFERQSHSNGNYEIKP